MQEIIDYLMEKYQPLAMIVYGSYADGTNSINSDFDCLIASRQPGTSHDTGTVCGVALDAYIYHPDELSGGIDPYEFVQIDGGIIVTDTDGIAAALMQQVRRYLDSIPVKPRGELLDDMAWCEKMALRAERGDAEGYFRWHWLLCDSLEVYCGLTGRRYLGPKKSLLEMEKRDPAAYVLYSEALGSFSIRTLKEWLHYLRTLANQL